MKEQDRKALAKDARRQRAGKVLRPDNTRLERRARFLQENATPYEKFIANLLTSKNIPFKTQVVIGWYIADIVIDNKFIILELDGYQHYTPEGMASDESRSKWLGQFGFTVIRIKNHLAETFDVSVLKDYAYVSPHRVNSAIARANKERNRALSHKPVQQERWKLKDKQKPKDGNSSNLFPSITRWQDVPQLTKDHLPFKKPKNY